jgi:hypothetical protein
MLQGESIERLTFLAFQFNSFIRAPEWLETVIDVLGMNDTGIISLILSRCS